MKSLAKAGVDSYEAGGGDPRMGGSSVKKHGRGKFVVPARDVLMDRVTVLGIGLFLLTLVVVFSVTTDGFLTTNNWLNIINVSAPLIITAVGATFIIVTAGIDLSVGSGLAALGCAYAALLHGGLPEGVVLLVVLAFAVVIGAFNGYMCGYRRIFPFIVTLAGLFILAGVALTITQGITIAIPSDSLAAHMGTADVWGIPVSAFVTIGICIIAYWLYNTTPFGRHAVALGSNRESLRRAGVNVSRLELLVYVLGYLCLFIAALIAVGQLGAGSSAAGLTFELQVITAVVLGGTLLFGGFGSIVGTVLGALTLGVIYNGLVLIGVSPYYNQIVIGSVLLLAVIANSLGVRGHRAER